ncbi:MAG TPA: SUMF1/EgtB/PvdO family nonheme iron enzyme [Bryobacteraceae bacterium]|nr:SUMF1/EgtB/PvdO family nonheme iron enzyme [Bryobacteraceae bacterium]
MEPPCVRVPGGYFLMGCEQGRDEERPEHRVRVDDFLIGMFPVRNRDYAVFLESTRHPPPPLWNDAAFNHPDQPVAAVSWFEAAKYCEWLCAISEKRYRLPSEAEWERAARGGREGQLYTWGNEPPQEHAAYLRRWGGEIKGTLAVGGGEANAWGIYELGENVHEWCSDWFQRDYYAASPENNPQGPAEGQRRASRGGSWRHHIKVSRCAARSSIPPHFQYADYGFRVAQEILRSSAGERSA